MMKGALPVSGGSRDGRWRLAQQLTVPAPWLNRDSRFAIRVDDEGIALNGANGWNVLAEDVEPKERCTRLLSRRPVPGDRGSVCNSPWKVEAA